MSSSPRRTVPRRQLVLKTLEDRTVPSISVGNAGGVEGQSIPFTVSLDAASSGTVTVAYATADGSAVAGTDYTAANGTVTFAPGQTSQTVLVATTDDSATEPPRAFTLNLFNPIGDSIANGQGTGTIYDNDGTAAVPAGVVSWWTGDVDGTDRSGPNNGSLSTGVAITPGMVSNAFSFDDTNYVAAPTTGLPTGNADRTMEMWVYINAFGSSETFFAGYGAFGTANEAYAVGAKTNHRLYFSQWGQSDNNAPVLSAGQWYYVAVTSVGNAFTLYLNGQQVDSGSYTISTPAGTQFYIGRIPGSLGNTRFLNGLADEVTVYDRALSSNEILDIYNAGSHGKAEPVPVTIDQAGSQPDPTNGSPITFDVQFAVPVYGFNSTAISFAGSTVGGTLSAQVAGSGSSYTVTVTGMSGQGTVIASIPAGAAVDAQGNASVASTSTDDQVTFDEIPPTVTVEQDPGQADPTNASPITFDVAFDEPVVGFDKTKVTLGGSLAGFATVGSVSAGAAPNSYVVTVDVAGSHTGTVTASVAAGKVADLAGNPNLDSTSMDGTVTFDNVPPTVTVSPAAGQGNPGGGATVSFTVSFDEPIQSFTTADLNFTGPSGCTPAITGPAAGTNDYTVAFTGMAAGGTVSLAIDPGVVQDLAGNGNAGSNTSTITYVHSGSLVFSQPTYTANAQGGGTLTVTVDRIGGNDGPLTVNYATANGSAKAGTDYTAANGTLNWADQETAGKTIAIPILNFDELANGFKADPQFTVNLSNATLPGALGLPPAATLGVPVTLIEQAGLQFAQSTFHVDESAGTATVTVRRVGDTTGTVTVHYATAAGTATAGADYSDVNGILTWGAGDGNDKTFTVPVTDDLLDEGKETIGLTLSGPTGNAILGPQSTATLVINPSDGVTIRGTDKKPASTFTDADGDLVTVSLAGKTGTLTYFLTNGLNGAQPKSNGPLAEIDLAGTDPTKTTVTISVKKLKGGSGDGRLQLGEVDGTGFKTFAAKTADLAWAGFQLAGYAGSITVGNVSNGAAFELAGPLPGKAKGTKITAAVIGDGTDINVTAPLAGLSAATIGTATIEAPSVGTLKVKHDFGATLTVSGTGVAVGKPALGSLTVGGQVTGSTITVDGNIGPVTAGAFLNSTLAAGYHGTFTAADSIGSVKVTAKANGFANSDLYASSFGNVLLASVTADNHGTPFGVYAATRIKALSVPGSRFKYAPAGPKMQGIGPDFQVGVI